MSKTRTDDFGNPVYGMSGGPAEDLREGWALLTTAQVEWKAGKPHFWRRIENTDRYIALCGHGGIVKRIFTGQRLIFDPGDFIAARCSKCGLKRSKEVSGRR